MASTQTRSTPVQSQPQAAASGGSVAVTPQLRQWLLEQLEAGVSGEQVLQAMQASGWPEAVAQAAWVEASRAHVARLTLGASDDAPMPGPDLRGAPCRLWLGDREVQVLMTLALPRVVVLGGFLSHEECDELIRDARPRLARSETVVHATGGNEVNEARTSEGMFFGRGETPLCERIERRIASLLNWPVSHGEGLQVLRYGPGAQYEPHHDYFDPDQPGAATVLARGGQRLGTLVMYLQEPTQGGATSFPDAGLEVAPIKGHAVFFSYPRPEAACKTLHAGAPVLAGEKWVATKWLRQREFA